MMIRQWVRLSLALSIAALAWRVARTGELEGVLFGLPYDLRPPTLDHLRERVWNPRDERLFTPMVFGWGYTINVYELGRRLGLVAGA